VVSTLLKLLILILTKGMENSFSTDFIWWGLACKFLIVRVTYLTQWQVLAIRVCCIAYVRYMMFLWIWTAGKSSQLVEVCSPQGGNSVKARTRHSVHRGVGSDSTSMSADSQSSRHSHLTQHSIVSTTCIMNLLFCSVFRRGFWFNFVVFSDVRFLLLMNCVP
jgi:hypothetical protein